MSVHRFETLPAVPRILHNTLVLHVGISSFVGYARGRELANMSSSQVTLGPDSLRTKFLLVWISDYSKKIVDR